MIASGTPPLETIKNNIAAGLYSTITGKLLGRSRKVLRKKINLDPPNWLLAFTFTFLVASSGIVASSSLGYKLSSPVFYLFLANCSYILTTTLLVEYLANWIIRFIDSQMLDALEHESDFSDLAHLLENLFSNKRQLRFGIFFSIAAHVGFIGIDPSLLFIVGWPLVAANLVLNFFHGIVVYYFINYIFVFVKRLSMYQYKLFEPNPSASEIIHNINNLLNRIFYMVLFLATIFSVWMTYGNQFGLPNLSVILSLMISWGLGIGLLIIHFKTISSIIVAGKWRALKQIQSEIKALQSKSPILDIQTLEQMNKLLDYHERIKSTPNSLLDQSLFFGVFNTFIIPVVGTLIGNLKTLLPILLGFF